MPRLPGRLQAIALRALDPVFAARVKRLYRARAAVASRYLVGSGIEIGALNAPLLLPTGASVRYVDRMPFDDIAAYCPQFLPQNLAPVDLIDDGETLATLPDSSVDFVVANHMVEHSEDPIGTLKNHLRVLRPDGILFWALPDMRRTFDHRRELTTVEHLIGDFQNGAEGSRLEHCVEWVRVVDRVPEADIEDRARHCYEARANIHFHVWTQETFAALLDYCRTRLDLPFTIESLTPNGIEFIAILRKSANPPLQS